MSLREKLIAEIGEISEKLSSSKGENPSFPWQAERMVKILNSIFCAIERERSEDNDLPTREDWFIATAATFGAIIPEGATRTPTPLTVKDIQSVSMIADTVEITRNFNIWKSLPARKEAMTKWVQIDENTRVREPILDAFGQPKMKSLKSETISEQASMVFSFSLEFFEKLLTEIEQDSLIKSPTQNYVPDPLGMNLQKALSVFSLGFYEPTIRSMVMADPMMMHPRYSGQNYERQTPFKLFLKPEQGTDRLEVIVEPYSEEEIKSNRELIYNRRLWLQGDVSTTKTVKYLCGKIKEKYKELYSVKKESKK